MDDPNLKSEMESYKIENENLKRDNDRITVDYELKLESLRKEMELKSYNYENLMNNYQEIESKFKNVCDDKMSLNQNCHELSKEKFEIVQKFNTLESDYGTITELISRRENELLQAKTEIHELRMKIDEFKTKEIELKLNERDIEYRKKDIDKIEEMSLNRNRRLCDEIKALEAKLASTNKELFEERSNNNTIVFDLNLELENRKNEIKTQKKNAEKLKETVAYLEKVYEEKTESLRSALEGKSNIDSLLRKDLNAQKSISELLKSERDELLQKETTLIETIAELQDAFRENCEESTKMKEKFSGKLEEYEDRVTDLRRSLNEKEKELENANELLEKFRVKSLSEDELKAMNPATSAALGALKRGYSLTQIYSEYLQVATERNELKTDRDRLNEYIRTILEDIEAKAPSLRRQQEERCNMELTVATIGQKYERTLSDFFNCQSEVEELRKKVEDQAKKLKREEQTSSDLSRQVCCLLSEIETSRGTVIRSSGDSRNDGNQSVYLNSMRSANQRSFLRQSNSSLMSNNSSMDVCSRLTTANDVITTHLVTFKSICELQQQNIQLLEQLRDLSEQQEAQEGIINEQSLQQLANKLEKACTEVDQLREKVKHQKYLEKVIDRQRHLIQALSTLTGNNEISLLLDKTPLSLDCSDDASQSLIAYSDKSGLRATNIDNSEEMKQKISDYEKKINKLQSTVDKLKDEKESLKDRHSKILEDINKQISETKLSNENLLSKLSYNQEKTNTMEQNLVNRQLEMADLQNELSSTKSELAQRKEELKSQKNELLSSQSLARNYEATISDLRKNMQHIESLEKQIRSEREEKYELMKSTNNLATQIGNLQNAVLSSRSDDVCEEQQDLKTRIKQLSLELKQEKSKYQTSQEMWQAKINESGVKIDSLAAQLSTVGKANVIITTESRATVEHQKSPEKREKMSNLEEQIEELILTNKNLNEQLDRYKELLSNSEAKLRTNFELMSQLQSGTQEKIDEEKKRSKELEELLVHFQSENDNLDAEYKSMKESLEDKIRNLESQIEENNKNCDSLSEQVAQLKEKEAQLKSDLERQRQLTKEAMGNYQQELIYHAQESDSLQETNDNLRKYQAQERDLSQRLKEATLDRDQFKADLDSKVATWDEERGSLQKEIDGLRSQKESLNNRLVDLNDLVVNLKKMLDPTVEGAVNQAVIQKESDWNEVIQYLRQEKENAEGAKNQLEMDLYRLRNENSAQDETIQQLNNALQEERKFKMVEAEVSKHHSEVMRKLETVQMLTESNAMLRKDRERLKDELTAKIEKIAALQEMLEPLKIELKTCKNDLESVKLEVRSLENERDLWRQRCDSLLEKSKQVNPEDYKKLCIEKDEIQHSLLLEEDKNKKLKETVDEVQTSLAIQEASLREAEERFEAIRKTNDDNLSTIQKRDNLISQLKELGRKYKAEKASLEVEIKQISAAKDGQNRELEIMRSELTSSKASLVESEQKLKGQSEVGTSQDKGASSRIEYTMRLSMLEKSIVNLKSENEGLRKEISAMRSSQSSSSLPVVHHENIEEMCRVTEDNVPEFSQHSATHTTSTINTSTASCNSSITHCAPTVARVAANVHPVVQKAVIQVTSASNQIPPSTMASTSCQSTARQTAEIRPIPAVIMHTTNADLVSEPQVTINTVSVTTSLPANVVQALAASSVSTVIFPSSTVAMPCPINPVRNKRRLMEELPDISRSSTTTDTAVLSRDTDNLPSTSVVTDNSPLLKRIRLRNVNSSKEEMTTETREEVPVSTSDVVANNQFIGQIGEVETVDGDVYEDELTLDDGGDSMSEEVDDVRVGEVETEEDYSDEEDEGEDYHSDGDNQNNRRQNDDEELDEDSEEDDDEDEDDEDRVECIDLLSSDDGNDDDDEDGNQNNCNDGETGDNDMSHNGDYAHNDRGHTTDGGSGQNHGVSQHQGGQGEMSEARQKIEKITWHGNEVSEERKASGARRGMGLKFAQPIRYSMAKAHRGSLDFGGGRVRMSPFRNAGYPRR